MNINKLNKAFGVTSILLILFSNIAISQTLDKYCRRKIIEKEILELYGKKIETIEKWYDDKPYVSVANEMGYGYFLYDEQNHKILTKDYRSLYQIGDSDNFIFSSMKIKKGIYKPLYIGVLRNFTEEIILDYEELRTTGDKIKFKQNGLYGLLDSNLNVLIEPIYSDLYSKRSNFIAKKDNKYGLIDKNGKVLIDFQYDRVHHALPFIGIKEIERIDLEIVEGQIPPPSPPYCASGDTIDLYNLRFEKIETIYFVEKIYCYDPIYSFKKEEIHGKGYWLMYNLERHFFYNMKLKTPPDVYPKKGVIKITNLEGKSGLIDFDGNVVYPFKYKVLKLNNNSDYIIVKDDKTKKFGIVDLNDNVLVKLEYDMIHNIPKNEAPIKVRKKDKIGFINIKGKTVIPFIYDKGYSFKKGVAMVVKDGKWGMINKKNKVIIPFDYDGIYNFRDYLVVLYINKTKTKKKSSHYFDLKGNLINCE